MTYGRVALVTVDAAQLHGAPVDVEIAPCQMELVGLGGGVADFDLAETGVGGEGFNSTSAGIHQVPYDGIAIGGFG